MIYNTQLQLESLLLSVLRDVNQMNYFVVAATDGTMASFQSQLPFAEPPKGFQWSRFPVYVIWL